jgi:hypothetical protein
VYGALTAERQQLRATAARDENHSGEAHGTGGEHGNLHAGPPRQREPPPRPTTYRVGGARGGGAVPGGAIGRGGLILAPQLAALGRTRRGREQHGDQTRIGTPRLGPAEDQILGGGAVQFGPLGGTATAVPAMVAHVTSFSAWASARVTGRSRSAISLES